MARKKINPITKFAGPAAVVLILIITLASFFLPKDEFQLIKEKLVKNPNDFSAHLELAEKFLENNQILEAENELKLADQIQNTQYSILNTKELWQKKHYSDPNDIKKLIPAWEKIITEKPDFRDGWLQLAYLYYKIFENAKAKDYLQKALALDPNFEPARELEKIISSQ